MQYYPSYIESTAASYRHHGQTKPVVQPPTVHWSPSVPGPSSSSTKNRKFDRACDACRRRKTRCDGSKMPDGVCTNCVQSNKSCTYVETSTPRGPPKAYVVGLEDRLEKMELLLKRLRPEADFSAELGPPVIRDSWKTDSPGLQAPAPTIERKASASSFSSRIPYPSLPSVTPLPPTRRASPTSLSPGHPSDAERDQSPSDKYLSSDEEEPLSSTLKRLTLLEMDPITKADRALDNSTRFHGSSSSFKLVTVTRELKMKHLLEMIGVEDESLFEDVAGKGQTSQESLETPDVTSDLRREYWTTPTWELAYENVHITSPSLFPELQECWPPPDLSEILIDLYFRHCNSMFPILHRPTFQRQFAEKLYERDIWYACVCLGAFALGSRYSNDERVLLDDPSDDPPGEVDDLPWQRAGMKYYFATMGAIAAKRSVLTPTSLFEAQTLCLTSQYQSDTRWHLGSWIVHGIGIRQAEDVGAHRRKSYSTGPSIEDELWKRVWWYLVAWDRIRSVMLGRPCATREEDFDAELPLDVDDEHWENDDPELAFKQPPGKPSMIAGYICWLRLTDILAYVMRVFYTTDKSELEVGIRGYKQPDDILREVNGRLIEWTKTMPENLRWSHDIPDPVLANQSASLYMTYNLLIILLNRASIPQSILVRLREPTDPRHPVPKNISNALTSLAVVVNAAKVGARILQNIRLRGLSNIPMMLSASEICVAVLCLDIWIRKAQEKARRMKGMEPNLATINTIDAHMEDVESLLEGLRWAIPRWENAQETLAHLTTALPTPSDEPEGLEPPHLEVMKPAAVEHVEVSTGHPQYTYAQERVDHVYGGHPYSEHASSHASTSYSSRTDYNRGSQSNQYPPPDYPPTKHYSQHIGNHQCPPDHTNRFYSSAEPSTGDWGRPSVVPPHSFRTFPVVVSPPPYPHGPYQAPVDQRDSPYVANSSALPSFPSAAELPYSESPQIKREEDGEATYRTWSAAPVQSRSDARGYPDPGGSGVFAGHTDGSYIFPDDARYRDDGIGEQHTQPHHR